MPVVPRARSAPRSRPLAGPEAEGEKTFVFFRKKVKTAFVFLEKR